MKLRMPKPICPLPSIALAVALLLIAGLAALAAQPADQRTSHLPELVVSDNHRFLTTSDGRPFFWLGDTAWELFHRLNRDEAEHYLKRRAEQGFTVIQAVVLSELDGLKTPNAYGQLPLESNDPGRPNEKYFEHVDSVVAKANSLGLYVGMVPTWGSYWHSKHVIFTPENAETYGQWLGRRYHRAGIVWILGGDRFVENDRHRSILQAMARGLTAGDGGVHLKTFHPRGGQSSSEPFHDAEWLDFNMLQSGHSPESLNYLAIQKDYARIPTKPCLDGEPSYEYPPDAMPTKRPVGAVQVRRNAYWAVFAGAHGHTYGTHPVWQMYAPPRKPLWDVMTPWNQSLELPGAQQMAYLKALMLSRPFLSRIPDQELILDGQGDGTDHIQATRDGTLGQDDASYLMVYFPTRRKVTINTRRLAGTQLRGWWYDPTKGKSLALDTMPNNHREHFEPPDKSEGDWVLVLDDAGKEYPPPGITATAPSESPSNRKCGRE